MWDINHLQIVNTTRGVTVEMEVNVIRLTTATYVRKECRVGGCKWKEDCAYLHKKIDSDIKINILETKVKKA